MVELEINDTSRIHFDGGSIIRTSRTNPTKTPEGVARVAESLKRLGVDYLLTIGGDDTAFAASRLAKALEGLTVAHVPKTIDNDLPLPSDIVTFGFTTACNLGKELVRNLMQDAATTERWFFVTVMGRHAGHLALGIGGAAGATVTVIAEEFAGAADQPRPTGRGPRGRHHQAPRPRPRARGRAAVRGPGREARSPDARRRRA